MKEIRTTGGYIATQANETPEMIMARALKVAEHTIEEHEKRMKALAEENEAQKRINKQLEADTQMKAEEIKKLTPDADYARQTLTAVNTWNTNIIAKEMGMSAVTLNHRNFLMSFNRFIHPDKNRFWVCFNNSFSVAFRPIFFS